ncbi:MULTISPECIES: acetyl-CoA C-acyltransferase [unclassified Achromobacter]|uniref:acetyl-CoA C-acyltransferase n=1 Tax=unclassified Achromobacter TaxID=2626865 RepID=UPI000B51D8FD|nr:MULTISPECIES: acetyl-CoA C-acyltransferase [unclassified Achromobacter]OWT74976.1 acetyl-CoA acetyltransferase [Achromobacter sp. HZ28]OWT76584.1 acetyl-CoA acetyltransferase [Achromobacter sp. HZ34]
MTRNLQDVYIVAATRSPVGKAPRGMLRTVRPDDLLAHMIRAALARVPALDPAAIQDAVIGCARPEGSQGLNVARLAALLAGLPDTVAGMTVNRFCASGLSAIALAADRIRVGEADVMLAGGVESMSQVPMMGYAPSFSPSVFANDENIGIAYGMGLTAERVAQQWQVSREDQDAFALRSHQRALEAQKAGEFDDEISGVAVTLRAPDLSQGTGESVQAGIAFTRDEGPRADTSAEALARLKPVFAARGSVTAGNSSQTSDGAAVLLLASERAVRDHGLTPLARYVGCAVRGVAPDIMGIGPRVAIPAALDQAGLSLNQIDWIELNEAFAAQSLAVIRDLDLDPAKVNPLGGAIALGHPLGATGAIRAATLVHALNRRQLKYGMVTMCVGTGMGAAGIFERV